MIEIIKENEYDCNEKDTKLNSRQIFVYQIKDFEEIKMNKHENILIQFNYNNYALVKKKNIFMLF